jgi:hypothetical protein
MKKPNVIKLISTLTITVALAALAGCATKGNYQQGSATGTGLINASGKIAAGTNKVDTTLNSLNDLVNNPQGDLVPKYKKFNDSVSDLQALSDSVSKQFTDARVTGNQYFQNWDQQLALIKDQDLKNNSAQRKAGMQKEYDDLKRSYAQVQMNFGPFMTSLRDIQTVLGTDLTVGGVASVKSAATKANMNGAELKKSMSELSADFRDLGMAMQTSGPPAQPETATK